MARTLDLATHLPAGEWADIQVVAAPGMMAQNNWAVLAKGRWLREGGRPAFIKFMLQADSAAGSGTNRHVGAPRLEHLRDRLQSVKRNGASLPVVPILVVELDAEGLLVAMEEVRPLQSLMESGDARKYATKVLRDLDPTKGDVRWLHFDLCGRNTGVTEGESVVLIDLESLYLDDAGHYEVSVPAWKQFRAPLQLVQEVLMALAAGDGIPQALAETKASFEVILIATECVLGPLHPRSRTLQRSAVEAWLAPLKGDEVAELLGNTILTFMDSGTLPVLETLAAEVERLQEKRDGNPPPPIVVVETESTVPVLGALPLTPTPLLDGLVEGSATPATRAVERQLLAPMGNALRAGQLNWAGVRDYGNALTRLVELDPGDRAAWEELVFVLVNYEKDAARALGVLNRAVVAFSDDLDFQRMRTIVANWAMERKP